MKAFEVQEANKKYNYNENCGDLRYNKNSQGLQSQHQVIQRYQHRVLVLVGENLNIVWKDST